MTRRIYLRLAFTFSLALACTLIGGNQTASANPCINALTSADVVEAGNFIHTVWQTTNSYRTRYKAMKDDAGHPVVDIQSYITARGIPVDYRGYYRQNVDGSFSEDIKQIPNQWLAPNNSTENSLGAASYMTHLKTLAEHPAATQHEAAQRIQTALGQIHTDWFERNSSWTVPYGEPKTFAQAGIEQRYNGAIQFYRIAEKFGVLDKAPWAEAFKKLIGDLDKEKFAPFQNLTIAETYLAITHKTGARPAITGDPEMAAHFQSRLPTYDFAMPTADKRFDEAARVLEFLKRYKPDLAPNPKLLAPAVPPGSPARIYLIQNEGVVVAVMKIQADVAGLDEIISTIATEKTIPRTPTFAPVHNWSAGRFNSGDYFLIQEAAKSYEADRSFTQSFAEITATVHKIAQAAAQLHGPAKIFSLADVKAVSADLTTFRGNCFYDLRQTQQFLESETLQDAWLAQQIKTNAQAYSKLVEVEPQTLSPTLIHGDFHGGNLFVSAGNENTMLIDYAGSSWFMGKAMGTGDRGNDLGRMLGAVLVEGTRHRLDLVTQILPLMKLLLSEYLELVGVESHSPQALALTTSSQFYLNRFLSVNIRDTQGKKLKPRGGESIESLISRLFHNWKGSLL